MTEHRKFFVSGSYKLIRDICTGKYEFTNELIDKKCRDKNGKKVTIEFLAEFDSRDKVLAIYERAKELQYDIAVWTQFNSLSHIWEIPKKKLEEDLQIRYNPSRSRHCSPRKSTKSQLLKNVPGLKTGNQIEQPTSKV